LNQRTYEYYTMNLQDKAILKLDNNPGGQAQKNGLDKIVIFDAKDLEPTDFVCWRGNDGSIVNLKKTYDSDKETLTIQMQNPGIIPLKNMQGIYFGTAAKDLNLCDLGSAKYNWQATPDVSKNTAEAVLTSPVEKARDLKVTLKLLASGIVSLKWTYNTQTNDVKVPFEVPLEIVAPKNDKLSETQTLADYLIVGDSSKGEPLLTVKSPKNSAVVYKLFGAMLDEYLNVISGQVVINQKADGILGLAERVSSNLFLSTGVYSLWTLDTANPEEHGTLPGANLYGVHPFYMARATDETWFGVYTNLAAAQDWYLKRHTDDKTLMDVQTIAVGGLADMYFMFGDAPNDVTKSYHQNIVGLPVLVPQWLYGWN